MRIYPEQTANPNVPTQDPKPFLLAENSVCSGELTTTYYVHYDGIFYAVTDWKGHVPHQTRGDFPQSIENSLLDVALRLPWAFVEPAFKKLGIPCPSPRYSYAGQPWARLVAARQIVEGHRTLQDAVDFAQEIRDANRDAYPRNIFVGYTALGYAYSAQAVFDAVAALRAAGYPEEVR